MTLNLRFEKFKITIQLYWENMCFTLFRLHLKKRKTKYFIKEMKEDWPLITLSIVSLREFSDCMVACT